MILKENSCSVSSSSVRGNGFVRDMLIIATCVKRISVLMIRRIVVLVGLIRVSSVWLCAVSSASWRFVGHTLKRVIVVWGSVIYVISWLIVRYLFSVGRIVSNICHVKDIIRSVRLKAVGTNLTVLMSFRSATCVGLNSVRNI